MEGGVETGGLENGCCGSVVVGHQPLDMELSLASYMTTRCILSRAINGDAATSNAGLNHGRCTPARYRKAQPGHEADKASNAISEARGERS